MAPHVDLHVTVVLTSFGKFDVVKSTMIKKNYNHEHKRLELAKLASVK